MGIIDTVKQQVQILDVLHLQGFVPEKKGRSYLCSCPLHADSTPSFRVYPEQNRYYCFGCNASGDVVDLWAHMRGLRMGEAARDLARTFNLPEADRSRRADAPRPAPARPAVAAMSRRKDKLREYFRQQALDLTRVLDEYRRDADALLEQILTEAKDELRDKQRRFRTAIEAAADPEIDALLGYTGEIVFRREELTNADYRSLLAWCLHDAAEIPGDAAERDLLPVPAQELPREAMQVLDVSNDLVRESILPVGYLLDEPPARDPAPAAPDPLPLPEAAPIPAAPEDAALAEALFAGDPAAQALVVESPPWSTEDPVPLPDAPVPRPEGLTPIGDVLAPLFRLPLSPGSLPCPRPGIPPAGTARPPVSPARPPAP